MLNKVPEVTLAFWVIKIMSTTVGETGADHPSSVPPSIEAVLMPSNACHWPRPGE
jgi:hypothetical protein